MYLPKPSRHLLLVLFLLIFSSNVSWRSFTQFFFFFFSPGCGQVLRASRGQILLEGYPLNARCEWTIHVQAGFNVEIRWVLLTFSQLWFQVDIGLCNQESKRVSSCEPWGSEGIATTLLLVPQLFPQVWLVMDRFWTDQCCVFNSIKDRWMLRRVSQALGTMCLFRGVFKPLTAKHSVFSELSCTRLN